MHWYMKDGTPCYEVENASKPGEMRPVTLRDAKKLELVPSVTTVMAVASKEAIVKYRIRCAVESALSLPRLDDESHQMHIDRIIEDSKSHSIQAATFGTRIHAAIELWFLEGTRSKDSDIAPFVDGFIDWWADNYKNFRNTITDWKTQGTDDSFTFYSEWVIQASAYRKGIKPLIRNGKHFEYSFASPLGYGGKCDFAWITRPGPMVASVAISSKVPGLIDYKIWTVEQARWGWSVFKRLLDYWKVFKKYDPSFRICDQ